jgi:hypothetical protein
MAAFVISGVEAMASFTILSGMFSFKPTHTHKGEEHDIGSLKFTYPRSGLCIDGKTAVG